MIRHRPRAVIGILVAVAVMLILVDVRGGWPSDGVRGVAGAVAGPAERGAAWVRTQVTDRFGGSEADRARIAELEQQLAAARAQVGALAAGDVARGQLRELAAQAPSAGYATVPARVVSATAAQDPVRTVAVSVGSTSGVRSGLVVLGPGGVAGLVTTVSPLVSTVRLLSDPATQVAARVASSGELGVVRGAGQADAVFQPLDPLAPLTPGAAIVSIGAPDGQFAADLPIGSISGVTGSAAALTRAAQVAPAVDESTLDRVLILVPEGSDGGGR